MDRPTATKCLHCGYSILGKEFVFKVGSVCKDCYMNSSAKDIERWDTKPPEPDPSKPPRFE